MAESAKTRITRTELPDLDLENLAHWRADYRTWKTWDDVPPETRAVLADFLDSKANDHAGTSGRWMSLRTNRARFEAMWAHITRLASERLR
jgi:hypothetical protein